MITKNPELKFFWDYEYNLKCNNILYMHWNPGLVLS